MQEVTGSSPVPSTKTKPEATGPGFFRLSKKSRPADMCGWTGHIQGNLALRVCEPLCGECAVQRQILSPGGYQGEGISVPRLRAEMGSPWSVSFFDTLQNPRPQAPGFYFAQAQAGVFSALGRTAPAVLFPSRHQVHSICSRLTALQCCSRMFWGSFPGSLSCRRVTFCSS